MASVMLKIPGEKWWVEYDDVTFEVIATHNKPQITATIQALQVALLQYPDIPQEATDVQSLLNLISNCGWGDTKKARITQLVNNMYSARQSDPNVMEAARIQARIDELVALRERLV